MEISTIGEVYRHHCIVIVQMSSERLHMISTFTVMDEYRMRVLCLLTEENMIETIYSTFIVIMMHTLTSYT